VGEGNLSAVATGTPAATPTVPGSPTISNMTAGDGLVTVSWGLVSGVTSYNLYYKAGVTVDIATGTKIAGVTSPRIVTGLTNGTQYAFAVSAVNGVGEGNLSAVATGTPAAKWIVTVSTLTDPDGNAYTTVTIGTQVWTIENLKATKYNDGVAIPLVTDGSAWAGLTTPGYCWYANDIANEATYGALYNWYAVNTGRLAPAGWHVPNEADWTTLSTYLGGQAVAGGKIKEVGLSHWLSPNTGATNSSGFLALPGGYRDEVGGFLFQKTGGTWWSGTETDATRAYTHYLTYNSSGLNPLADKKNRGFSVRLVRD
jgi:uncharacterized protein (TIGR02145 family)